MAFLTCHFFSTTLSTNTTINIIFPTQQGGREVTPGGAAEQAQKVPVLYLLHGAYGDCNSWMRFSSIERYAQERGIAVVMASAGNEFYQDAYRGLPYETFFTRELPAFIRSLFPVSEKREDTFIAGFSMGGYGAWHLALAAPEVFGKAASLSGALDIAALCASSLEKGGKALFPWDALFEHPEALAGGHSDLFAQYAACAARVAAPPALYMACGTEDFLYGMNRAARDRMDALGASVTYAEAPGGHDWNFWDGHIRDVLDWLLAGREEKKS